LQYAIAARKKETPQHVLKDERPEISDVCEGVDGRAARIDSHLARMDRLEQFQAVRQRIVQEYGIHFVPFAKRLFYLTLRFAANAPSLSN
jgi:hypothetical protein